ncbi:DNA polymerase III subunit delta [Candidatus Gracilibacteria bacterium]|nr:DNA polymerase III subunit delta [Candidatus Gracilibacteria bacterium]
MRERINFYRDAFRKKYPDGDIEIFEEINTFADVENSVFTQNLFGGKRLLFLESFWDGEKFEVAEEVNFFEKLEEQKDTCTVMVIEPKLDKRTKFSKFFLEQAQVERFDPFDGPKTLRWIQSFAEKAGGKMSHGCAQKLLSRCGENLWHLSREIEKLVAFSEGEVTEKMITDLVLPNPQAVIWDFLESLSRRSVQSAFRRFRELLESGISVHEIFPMLQREVRIHAQLRSGIEQGLDQRSIASSTKLNPFVIQKTIPHTQHFSRGKIQAMYDQLFEMEQNIKTGKIFLSVDDTSELELAVEKFILAVCRD